MNKHNMRRIVSLLLAVAMVLSLVATTAAAKVYTDDVYTDVKPSDWFYKNVVATYIRELMIGKGNHRFAPNDYLTVAETVAIAARLHSNGAEFVQGDPWYQVYADYVEENGIADLDGLEMNVPATREQFVTILANALPEDAFEEINFVADGAIPDVPMSAAYAKDVYKLYRAGILIGNDAKGTFAALSKILRREVAAIITRMVDEALRLRVELGKRESEPIDDPTQETYTVEFLLNFPGGKTYLRKTVEAGETVAEPNDPNRAGYFFDGWYLGEEKYDFIKPVTGDLELVAHWKPNPYRPIMPVDPIDPDDNRTVKAVLTENSEIGEVNSNGAYEAVKKEAPKYKLTFYYDEEEYTVGENGVVTVYTEGEVGGLTNFKPQYDDEGDLTNMGEIWGWFLDESYLYITAVEIDSSMEDYTGFTSMSYMFGEFAYAESIIGAEYLNTSQVTDMSLMFASFGSESETFNAVPNVANWDTSQVTDMSYMFTYFGSESETLNAVPNVANWNTSSVENMSGMFDSYGYSSSALSAVPTVTHTDENGIWDTSKVTDMSYMFADYGKSSNTLTDVPDVANWDTSSVENMSYMFFGYACGTVPEVDAPMPQKAGGVTPLKTTSLTAPNVKGWNVSSVKNMSYMFAYYGKNVSTLNFTLDLSGWNTSSLTDAGNMFWYCANAASSWSVKIPEKSKASNGSDFTTANDPTHFYFGASYDESNFIIPAGDASYNGGVADTNKLFSNDAFNKQPV